MSNEALTARFVPPAPAELAPHFPQLEVLALVGHGGMGAVYKARQRQLNRMVALKILPPEAAQDPTFAERFTREAQALARLNHPRIVAVHDFGQTCMPLAPAPGAAPGGEGLYYFIMEYVEGSNLRELLARRKLEPREVLAIVPQICQALQYAHDEGIVHRDIKPENILVDTQGQVKIADFGLARLLRHKVDAPPGAPASYTLTGSRQVMGTPHYMAPEQVERPQAVDHRADIYSLGVVFYEMLTGELPLGKFPAPSARVQIDVRLDEVVLRSLEKEPARRYQHASDLKCEVESISKRTLPASPAAPGPVSDQVLFRRLTRVNLAFGTVWAALLSGLHAGYLAGAEWYFKQELPYNYLRTALMVFSAWLAIYLCWWWYVLAKRPDSPRSPGDFWKVLQTPDQRAKRMWKPVIGCLGIYAFMTLAGFALPDAAQSTLHIAWWALAPFVCMAIVWRTYRDRNWHELPKS